MAKSILQTPFWAELKAKGGWQSVEVAESFVLVRPLKLGMTMAYAPEVSEQKWQEWLPKFTSEIRDLAGSYKMIFVRLEIDEELKDPEVLKKLIQLGYKKSFEEVQPEYRQIVDIKGTEAEILGRMKPKGRYNINLAKRHGVKVEIHRDLAGAEENAKLFYKLMTETGERKQFSIRPMSYFRDLLKTLYINKAGFFVTATFNEQLLAALIISEYDGVATYLYGASSNQNREVMAPYLAHFAAIQEAKKLDCESYDLLAIAPPGEEDHKYANLTRFKSQFGGKAVALVGSWDLIFRPTWYTMFSHYEKRRRHL